MPRRGRKRRGRGVGSGGMECEEERKRKRRMLQISSQKIILTLPAPDLFLNCAFLDGFDGRRESRGKRVF